MYMHFVASYETLLSPPPPAAPTKYEFLDGLKYEVLTFNPDDGSGLAYEAIVLSPKTTPTTATPPPLVVFPHGGPHTLNSTEFYAWSSCLAALGFAVLFGMTTNVTCFCTCTVYHRVGRLYK
jgi:dipeptidyl aminopeptidase/acylaminoacyl peptidase